MSDGYLLEDRYEDEDDREAVRNAIAQLEAGVELNADLVGHAGSVQVEQVEAC